MELENLQTYFLDKGKNYGFAFLELVDFSNCHLQFIDFIKGKHSRDVDGVWISDFN